MYFKDLLKRAELKSIKDFIVWGEETYEECEKKSYEERMKDAERNIGDLFEEYFPDNETNDKAFSLYYKQMSVYQDVFFEMGMLAGAHLALEINEKLREIS